MKKIMLFSCMFLLFGCASRPTLESFVEDNIEGAENEIKLIENYKKVDFDDVSFGISLIETENNGDVFYLSGMVIDESSSVSYSYHGSHEPIYLMSDTQEFIWQWDVIDEFHPYLYMELESEEKLYYAGIKKGVDLDITYDQGIVKTAESTINIDESVDVTLWVVEIDKQSIFNLDKLGIKQIGKYSAL